MLTLNRDQAQRGFSLAETAAVLAIGGLIVGAALKGGDLIEGARLGTATAQITNVQSATSTFRDRFNAYPGDFQDANEKLGDNLGLAWAHDGDGDGFIRGASATNGDEGILFWNHLAAAKLISGVEINQDVIVDAAFTFGEDLPGSTINGGLTVDYESVVGTPAHWITLGTADSLLGVVDASTARAMDKKLDDGRPGVGTVRMTTSACTEAGGTGEGTAKTDEYVLVPTDATINCLMKFTL